jgi:hypothetical protein
MQVIVPINSFVQFTEMDTEHCTYGTVRATLPVYNDNDIAFQFVVRGTEDEIDELATFGNNTAVKVGIVGTDIYESLLLEFSDVPERFRISTTDMLYNWTAGLPGFYDVITVGECFKIGITVNVGGEDQVFTSNLFERIGDDCFTSVIEYGSDDNGFGFNYCGSGDAITGPGSEDPGTVDPPPGTCEPTRILFTNMATMSIPYTAQLQAMYGATPTVQAWIYDENGDLVNMGIQIKMDGSPPTTISFDFGGVASGVAILKG